MNFKNIFLLITSFFILGALNTHANASTQEPIGNISIVIGDVEIQHTDSTEQKAEQKAPIYLGDVISTKNDDSFVRVDFIDGTNITMNGMDAELAIDEYIFDPAHLKANKANFKILRGSFEFVGGLLDKGESENVQIDLDFGSIGVRGTKVLRAMKDNECWIYLEEGEIRVFNGAGTRILKAGDGTRIKDKLISPTEVKPWSQKNIDWIKSEVALPVE